MLRLALDNPFPENHDLHYWNFMVNDFSPLVKNEIQPD